MDVKLFLTCVPSRRGRSVSWWPWWWSRSWWAWPGPPPRCTRPQPAPGSTARSAQPAHNATWSTTTRNTLLLNQNTQILRPRMRSSLVVRASDCQCTSCNGPGFDPSIRRHSGIWGAADEAVLNIVRTKRKNPPKKKILKKKKNIEARWQGTLPNCYKRPEHSIRSWRFWAD